MGAPTSLLGNARAFARDFPRDKMPRDYLWDVADYVPTLIDTSLTGRGGWQWGSDAANGDIESGILATFTAGEQALIQTTAGSLYQVAPMPSNAITFRGAVHRGIQNPVQLYDNTIWFDGSGAAQPILVTSGGQAFMDASAPHAKVGAVWKDYVIAGGAPAQPDALWFSVPNNPAAAWDVNSFQRTAMTITGLAVIRSVILVFHAGSTERIRGSIPPHTGATNSDLNLEPLFSRAGCRDPQSIAYWNENVVFADEHGVHITDGAVIRNLASQGGISYFWRMLFGNKATLAACTFLDYYIITVRATDGSAVTLVCDLNKRQWFRFTNIKALCYIASGGSLGMERVWAGQAGTNRTIRIGPCFFPTLELAPISDADGTAVLPTFETPWYRLGQEGRKRVRFVYLSYDARGSGQVLDMGYVRSPQQTAYTTAGRLPGTDQYRRYRLPVNQFPYGVAFRVRQTVPTSALRVFDLGVEAGAAERSRI